MSRVLPSYLVVVAPLVGAKSLGIVMARSRIDAAVIICQLLVSHLQFITRKRVETYAVTQTTPMEGEAMSRPTRISEAR